jgi:hypothetical protein
MNSPVDPGARQALKKKPPERTPEVRLVDLLRIPCPMDRVPLLVRDLRDGLFLEPRTCCRVFALCVPGPDAATVSGRCDRLSCRRCGLPRSPVLAGDFLVSLMRNHRYQIVFSVLGKMWVGEEGVCPEVQVG